MLLRQIEKFLRETGMPCSAAIRIRRSGREEFGMGRILREPSGFLA